MTKQKKPEQTEPEVVETVTPYTEQFVSEGDYLTLLTPIGFATGRLSEPGTVDELKDRLRKQVRGE